MAPLGYRSYLVTLTSYFEERSDLYRVVCLLCAFSSPLTSLKMYYSVCFGAESLRENDKNGIFRNTHLSKQEAS